jgi:hypothetical protein
VSRRAPHSCSAHYMVAVMAATVRGARVRVKESRVPLRGHAPQRRTLDRPRAAVRTASAGCAGPKRLRATATESAATATGPSRTGAASTRQRKRSPKPPVCSRPATAGGESNTVGPWVRRSGHEQHERAVRAGGAGCRRTGRRTAPADGTPSGRGRPGGGAPVPSLHAVAWAAVAPAAAQAWVSFEETGRAHALVEGAGALIHRAAGLLLGVPAVDQALWERSVPEVRGTAAVTQVDARGWAGEPRVQPALEFPGCPDRGAPGG